MGFDPDGYVDVLTSGELVFEGMQAPRASPPYSEIKGSRSVSCIQIMIERGALGFKLLRYGHGGRFVWLNL